MNTEIQKSPLGKATAYKSSYNPDLLFPIERATKRNELDIKASFSGFDYWNAFEVSWLNPKGKPCVALTSIQVPASSPCLIESKSLKLYLNSFSGKRFDSLASVQKTINQDISNAIQSKIQVSLTPLNKCLTHPENGSCLDLLDIEINHYGPVSPEALIIDDKNIVHETLYSHLLKSNCPCTEQPDWGTLIVHYKGPKIDQASLLKYICSYRQTYEFAEQCTERVFRDVLETCSPEQLTIQALYTRRGGIDINPIRSTEKEVPVFNIKDPRQ